MIANNKSWDCRAYCTSLSYNFKQLAEYLKAHYKVHTYRDVVHVEIPQEEPVNIFYFSYGVTVFWGLSKEAELQFLKAIRDFEESRHDDMETDIFTYTYGDIAKVVEDEIILPNREAITKLAISQAIAQSVKLGSFEVRIQKTFNQSKNIPQDLAKRGRISLSKREIRKKMGELFIERNSVNLHFDVLDIPEFFWEYPELDPLYYLMASYLDIKTRVEVLNQRLDVIHELFQMLGSELNHQHSSRLEWTIIWLIIIEVVLSLMRDVFRII